MIAEPCAAIGARTVRVEDGEGAALANSVDICLLYYLAFVEGASKGTRADKVLTAPWSRREPGRNHRPP
jgi:hypothetical protein